MIDLRSDTTTLPSRRMLEAILKASLGDDGRIDAKGRGEDLTVNALEDLAAQLTGKEAALLFPTGTLGNTTAILTHVQAGDRVLIDRNMHIVKTEKIVFDENFGQLIPEYYSNTSGHQPDFQEIHQILDKKCISLLAFENTHNFNGGTCLNEASLSQIRDIRKQYDIPMHLDGARLFNASVSSQIPISDICDAFDSVMFCLSKGLGAPIGSLVCGSKDFIVKARERRKLLGGGMRQAGVIAAPGIVALQDYEKWLLEDHALCAQVAKGVENMNLLQIKHSVESNIIMLNLEKTTLSQASFCAMAEAEGLFIKPVLDHSVRLVFHRDVDRRLGDEIIQILLRLDKKIETWRKS